MAYVEMISEADATDDLAKMFTAVKARYTQALGFEMTEVPDLYRISSQVPAYSLAFGEAHRAMTDDGRYYGECDGPVHRLFSGFTVAALSACFH